MRVFVAIDISQEAQREVEKLLKVFQKKHWPVRWERPEKLHLTLVFLGEVEKNQIQLIKLTCQKAVRNTSSFEVSFKGAGCFPGYNYPRIIWLGLKGDLKSLAALQKEIEKGLKIEKLLKCTKTICDCTKKHTIRKFFSPHITLGRIKDCRAKQRREIGRQLKRFRILDLKSKILVDQIVIYQSKLSSKGSRYYKLEEIKFGFRN